MIYQKRWKFKDDNVIFLYQSIDKDDYIFKEFSEGDAREWVDNEPKELESI